MLLLIYFHKYILVANKITRDYKRDYIRKILKIMATLSRSNFRKGNRCNRRRERCIYIVIVILLMKQSGKLLS